MEPAAAAWGPWEFQLGIPQEPAAGGIPVEYASIDVPATATCRDQAYQLPESSGVQQQLVEYYNNYSAAAPQHSANNTTCEKALISNDDCHARCAVKKVLGEFEEYMGKMEYRMHRYPSILRSVDEAYTLPRIVSIGPYHHGLDHLKPTETMKHAAACYCVMQSGRPLVDLFGAVVPIADSVACLYDKDVMKGINPEDFRHMMFFDACFLVQFMLMYSGREKIDKSLHHFLSPNRVDIFRDVMLLENQIPWIVVETVISFMPMKSTIARNFVRAKRHCLLPDDVDNRDEHPQLKPFVWDEYASYKPPHLLGLIRYYIVGRSETSNEYVRPTSIPNNIPFSVNVMKLTEIGITLTANKTTELVDMTLKENLFAELSLPPVSLAHHRASVLINMAAFEQCTVKNFSRAKNSESAFCSYLNLLAMLVSREEDVQELRVRGLLVGGRGLTNKEALTFLKSFQGLRVGQFYFYVMVKIESYREKKRMQNKCYSSYYKNKTTLGVLLTVMLSVGGIIATILTSKK